MPRRLLVVLVAVLSVGSLAVAGCSVSSPKLAPGPTVTTGPDNPTTAPPTTVAGADTVPPATVPSTASSAPAVAPAADQGCPAAAPAAVAGLTTVATAKAGLGSVEVFPAVDADQPCLSLPNPDPEFSRPQVFVALQDRDGWTQVQLPSRPNNSLGWVRSADLDEADHPYRIEVSISGRRVQVFDGSDQLVETSAAVGTGDTPTPPGTYYLVALIKPTNGGYGPYAYALSGHSEALFSFAGGDGRIGLHGTDDPNSIGNAVSHGCIRIPNDVITRMVEQIGLPLGTPVVVNA